MLKNKPSGCASVRKATQDGLIIRKNSASGAVHAKRYFFKRYFYFLSDNVSPARVSVSFAIAVWS